jgi:4-hydroxy-3-methylbut-2-enyl diphosphate reductase
VAQKHGVVAYMVDNATYLETSWFENINRVGVTAGASAPEVLVQAVVDRLKEMGATEVIHLTGIEERVVFPMPKGLNQKI